MNCNARRVIFRLAARSLPGAGLVCLLLLTGCGAKSRSMAGAERFDHLGRTYYIDGAGNWGFGVTDVQRGLYRAGYRGNIINYRWSPTFNPALDQTVGRVAARSRGRQLAREITAYLRKYPHNQVNIIALSAGTGVAVWACENLEPPAKVNCLILLGSSLSAYYDMNKALENIARGVWVYYSPYDQVLSGPVRALGTIDGRMIADSAGLIGLHPPGGPSEKIHNIGWSPRWERYGWSGAHTDATSEPFVRQELARHILSELPEPSAPPEAWTEKSDQLPDNIADAATEQPHCQPATRPAIQIVVTGE
jgi:pimeloyl-ACP methyl ester carboxylesterase